MTNDTSSASSDWMNKIEFIAYPPNFNFQENFDNNLSSMDRSLDDAKRGNVHRVKNLKKFLKSL